jgi:hypothetical protein
MATKGFRVRLDDGSEMDLDSDMLRSWYEQGLIRDDTKMRAPGSRNWQRMDQVVELGGWKNPDRAARRGRDEGLEQEEPAGPDKWRSYVASGILFVATAACTYLMFFPDRWTPALAPMPWREVTLGALVLALSLVRGWPIGRMFARSVMLVVAFALFPLAGLVIAQGVRGLPLLVLLSAWIVASAFFVFLGRVVATSSAVACLLTIALGVAGIFYFGYVPAGAQASAPAGVRASVPPPTAVPAQAPSATASGLSPTATPAAAATPTAAATPMPSAPATHGAASGAPAASPAAAAAPTGVEQAVRAAIQEVPLLSAPGAEALMAHSAAGVLDPPEVFRRAYGLVGRGLWALNKAESREFGDLHTLVYDSLPTAEKNRLGDYIDRARSRYATTPEEDRQMCQVMKTAVLALPADRRARMQVLFEKSMTAGLSKP